ncbi:MAG: hypothetical protein LBO74_17665 [Candidatus Symbiothrix sp.]|jgi:hypothetical protein|nr:hypothetical protein [Candidatus Symbiothrix sp.]
MLHKKANRPIVRYNAFAETYLDELIDILLEQGYFSFRESAKKYVDSMKEYVEQHIFFMPQYPAPQYFDKYKVGMKYITYHANKRTTWYLFFRNIGSCYIIYYITNNHFEGQYIR